MEARTADIADSGQLRFRPEISLRWELFRSSSGKAPDRRKFHEIRCCPLFCISAVSTVKFSPDFHTLYSLRSASIGFRFAALIEGRSPKIIPIIMENATEKTIAGTLIATGVLDI